MLIESGDAILTDSNYAHRLDARTPYANIHLSFSEPWIRSWLQTSAVLASRNTPGGSSWARALLSFVMQLSRVWVVSAPLPQIPMADQMALLAPIANEIAGACAKPTRQERVMHRRIEEFIVQRCMEDSLSAADVAQSLNVSTRTQHRHLDQIQADFCCFAPSNAN